MADKLVHVLASGGLAVVMLLLALDRDFMRDVFEGGDRADSSVFWLHVFYGALSLLSAALLLLLVYPAAPWAWWAILAGIVGILAVNAYARLDEATR